MASDLNSVAVEVLPILTSLILKRFPMYSDLKPHSIICVKVKSFTQKAVDLPYTSVLSVCSLFLQANRDLA